MDAKSSTNNVQATQLSLPGNADTESGDLPSAARL